jgi:hypothetical protein
MLKMVFSTLRFIVLILAGHKQFVLENAALRQQLATSKGNGRGRDSHQIGGFANLVE